MCYIQYMVWSRGCTDGTAIVVQQIKNICVVVLHISKSLASVGKKWIGHHLLMGIIIAIPTLTLMASSITKNQQVLLLNLPSI